MFVFLIAAVVSQRRKRVACVILVSYARNSGNLRSASRGKGCPVLDVADCGCPLGGSNGRRRSCQAASSIAISIMNVVIIVIVGVAHDLSHLVRGFFH